ncbi:MAG: hypothetical protein COB60_10675 [Flavobacteriaceae bacterium]|nr:MAG: hypothetical protein COB60_10675 [Flavobacteriaceae bacterium]
MNKLGFSILVFIFSLSIVCAQNTHRAITTAAPFLLIAPDARAGGMGDIGVATTADANSQYWNAAKHAFTKNKLSMGVFYTPWLRELTNDVFLGGFTITNRLDERSAWGASVRYFNLGDIPLTDIEGAPLGTDKLNEFSVDGSYALLLSESYSMAVTLRYIRSDLGIESTDSSINPVNTFAVDISGYFESEEKNYGGFNGRWRGGYSISNIGPKVSYSDDGNSNFIPTNLRVGTGFDFILDGSNTIALTVEFNKLLVPTPPVRSASTYEIIEGKDDNVSFVSGMFQSFSDAPGGASEELKEVTWAIGAEYVYNKLFAFRAGYFNESELKGSRKYFTIGSGFNVNNTTIDVSYLFNATDINNPLENTLRFSLSFDIGN